MSGSILFFTACTKITLEKEPKVLSGEILFVDGADIEISGTIIDVGDGILQYGHCWSKSIGASVDDEKTELGTRKTIGSYTSYIENLDSDTRYYIRSYCISSGILSYGEEIEINTFPATSPRLTTGEIIKNDSTEVIITGRITDLGIGQDSLIDYGHCWALHDNPTIEDSISSLGARKDTGNFESKIHMLDAHTNYHVRAYAKTSLGVVYGNLVKFTSADQSPSGVSLYFAVWQATNSPNFLIEMENIGDGGTIISVTVCWSMHANPTISDSSLSFSWDLSIEEKIDFNIPSDQFECGKNYYFTAYVENSVGSSSSNTLKLTMSSPFAPWLSISTPQYDDLKNLQIRITPQIVNCDIISNYKLCYSNNPEPTIADNTIDLDINNLIHSQYSLCSLNDLEPGHYYFRGYLENQIEGVYSEAEEFYIAPEGILMDYYSSVSYTQGSEQFPDSKPVHDAFVNPFMLSQYEITNEQFCSFLNSNGVNSDGTKKGVKYFDIVANTEISHDGTMFQTNSGQLPVTYVSWHGASAFCEWIGGRLPTETEWEYSALGGAYSWYEFTYAGSNSLDEYGWFSSNSNSEKQIIGTKRSSFSKNWDMSGNVREWCADWYDANYYSVSPTENPTGPDTGLTKVVRGGSYLTGEDMCRVYSRDSETPETCAPDLGFRVLIPL